MMMTLGQVIHRMHMLTGGIYGDESYLSNRLLYTHYITGRSLLLSQAVNKKQDISTWSYQTLHGIAMAPAVDDGTYVLRSTAPLPRPLHTLYGPCIQSILTDGHTTKIDVAAANAVRYQQGLKYGGRRPLGFMREGYLYVTNALEVAHVHITAVFEDVIAAHTYGGGSDDYMSIPSYTSASMVDAIINMSLQALRPPQQPQQNEENRHE